MLEGELSTALFVIAAGEVECFGGELGVSRATLAAMDKLGTPMQLIRAFRGKAGFEHAVHALQHELYQEVA